MQSNRIPKAVPYVTVQHLKSNTQIPIGKLVTDGVFRWKSSFVCTETKNYSVKKVKKRQINVT